jgi:hypothetical protein
MKLSLSLTLVIGIAFTALCFAYAGYGWWELAGMSPGQARDDARGFALFWAFLGAIGLVCAYVAWRLSRGEQQ